VLGDRRGDVILSTKFGLPMDDEGCLKGGSRPLCNERRRGEPEETANRLGRHLFCSASRPGQQEFGIAAALSGDRLMMDAYRSGDPYLTFAKQAGAAPPDATKATHKAVRDQFKSTVLAVQYGMGADALAQRIGQPPIRARELLRLHRETYRVFWRWSDAAPLLGL
jgi:hypothetical protein